MNKRWVIVDENGDILKEVHPSGVARFGHDWDLSFGLIAKRLHLKSDLRFIDDDYAYFLAKERRASQRCQEIIIRRDWFCRGRWETKWTGTFSTGSGRWNRNPKHCSFIVRPETKDQYSCLIKLLGKKVNVLKAETVDAQAALVLPLEFFVCSFEDFAGETACAGEAGNPDVTGWRALGDVIDGPTVYRLYGRRREQTECVGGNPVPPPGTGWILLENNCATDGTAIYVKQLTDDELFEANITPVLGTCVDGIAVPPSGCPALVLVEDCSENDPPVYACIGQAPQPLTGARLLRTIIETLVEPCDIEGLVSDFFEWDPPGDAVGYVAGNNYETGLVNEVDALILVQKSDAIDPFADQAATIGELSLKEVLVLLANSMRVFWSINADGKMRFEHWSYWTFPVGLQLSDYDDKDKTEPLSYSHLTSEIPRFERLKFMEAQSRDFVGVDIEYSGPCVGNNEEAKEWNAGPFTTDLAYIMTVPTAISTSGFAFVATKLESGTYNVIIGPGSLTNNIVSNAPLSTANLQDAFWRKDRYLPEANMNRIDEAFEEFLPTVEQKGVSVTMCCDFLDFDPSQMVATALAELLGVNGIVTSTEWDEKTNMATLTLRYAY